MSRLKFKVPFHPFRFFKRFMPKSLFGRSLIILMTPLILVQVILSYLFFERHTDSVLDLLAESIVGDIMMVVDMVEHEEPLAHIQRQAERNFKFQVSLDPDKTITRFGSYRDKWLYQYMSEHLNKRLNYLYFLKISDTMIHVEIPLKEGVLDIKTPRKRLYNRSTPYVVIWTAASALLLFIVASLFMRNQIRPIRRLADAAEEFGKGGEAKTFRPEGATEVRKAGHAFKVMRDRLKRHMSERTEMLAGVSHDLRTPLARMKLQLAMMPPSDDVDHLQEDVSQMHQMVQGFLDFSRGVGAETSERIDIEAFFKKLKSDWRHSSLKVHMTCPHSIFWQIKPELFKRCLTNLVLNSERFAKTVWIIVSVESTLLVNKEENKKVEEQYLQIIIDDDGPGIPLQERENVFRPFYRLDASRNLDSGNVGLGMNIARDVVTSHGGEMILAESPQKGLRVIIRVPM